jgi:hypothetical protein
MLTTQPLPAPVVVGFRKPMEPASTLRVGMGVFASCLILAGVFAAVIVLGPSQKMESEVALGALAANAPHAGHALLLPDSSADLIKRDARSRVRGAEYPLATPEDERRLFSIPQEAVLIRFPDGESIAVEFRRVPPIPALEFRKSTAPIIGDANYAYTQYQISDRCLDLLQSEEILGLNVGCTHSTDYYAIERDRWLQEAVESGDVHAIKKYAELRGNTVDALTHLERAWQAGYIPPLGRIAESYFDRVSIRDEQGNNSKALAYLWLQAHLQDAAAGDGRRAYVAYLYEKLNLKQQQMDSREIEEAIQIAKELLRSNVHCCFGP